MLSEELNWSNHIDFLMKKLNSRLYCLRKLGSFKVDPKILSLFHQSIIASVLPYCIVRWGGSADQQDKDRV